MKPRLVVPLIIAALLLAFGAIAAACGGGDSAQPPTSEATPTAAPPSPTPTPTPTPTPEAEETLGHYENSELGFTFDYPDHWEQVAVGIRTEVGEVETVARITVGTLEGDDDDLFLSGMDVTVNRLTEAISEDEYFEIMDNIIVQVAGQAGGVLEEKDWTELAGQRARRYVLNIAFAGVPLTSEQVTTIQGDLQFTLDCQGERARFEEVRADCQVVLGSFEFTAEQ
jgi:hypothetical protein